MTPNAGEEALSLAHFNSVTPGGRGGLAAADGQWPRLLQQLAGVTPEQLTPNRHQPCPACQGTDRYRWISDDGPGSWFCSRCGGRDGTGGGGTGIGLLMRLRNLSFKQAATMVEDHLGIPHPTGKAASGARKAPARRLEAVPDPVQAPAALPPAPPALATIDEPIELQHPYSYSDTQRVVRIEATPTRKKRFVVFHREAPDAEWEAKAGDAPWPILNQALIHQQRQWVLEAEGEKCVGILLAAGVVAYCHPGHAHKIEHCLARYRAMVAAGVPGVVLLSDNDEEGERRARVSLKAAAKAGLPMLHVQATSAWGELPQGGSIDDAPGTIDDQLEALEQAIAAAWTEAQQPPEPEPPPLAFQGAAPFQPLGQDGDGFIYRTASGGLVTLARSRHTPICLVSLAPIAYWETNFPNRSGKGGVDWQAAASELFAHQARIPPFDPDRVRGRGLWREESPDRVIAHLGDRLLVDGQPVPLGQAQTAYIYDRRPPLPDLAPEPLSDDAGRQVLEFIRGAGWRDPMDHLLVAGAIVLAPVGNALDRRPQLVVTAPRGAGKTEGVLKPAEALMGGPEMVLFAKGWTASAVRQSLAGDVLPVICDEWENAAKTPERRDQWGELLRVAYDGGECGRGTAHQQAIRQLVSSAFILAGINVEGMDEASRSRGVIVQKGTLSQADIRRQVQTARQLAVPDLGRRLIRRTMANLPTLRQNAETIQQALEGMDSRRADVFAHLLAGALLLVSTERLESVATARAWLDRIKWQPDEAAEEDLQQDSEGRRCLERMLRHVVRWDELGDRSREITVGELIEKALAPGVDNLRADEVNKVLGRLGVKVLQGKPWGIYVAKRCSEAIYRGTTWADGNHWGRLLDLEGAQKEQQPQWFPVIKTQRCVLIPYHHLDLAEPTLSPQREVAA